MLKITILTDELKKNCQEFYEYAWAVANNNGWKSCIKDDNLLQDETNKVVYYKENGYTFATIYEQDACKTRVCYELGSAVDVLKDNKYVGTYNPQTGRVFLTPRCEQFVKELQA